MKTNDVILQTTATIVSFLIFLFAIHSFFAGHYAPGGGFVGGLLAASAIVLLLLAYDLKTITQALPINYVYVIATGLLFSLGTAATSILFDVPFFTHKYVYINFPLLGEQSLHSAMAFDLGVFLVVVGVTMTIIQSIGGDD